MLPSSTAEEMLPLAWGNLTHALGGSFCASLNFLSRPGRWAGVLGHSGACIWARCCAAYACICTSVQTSLCSHTSWHQPPTLHTLIPAAAPGDSPTSAAPPPTHTAAPATCHLPQVGQPGVRHAAQWPGGAGQGPRAAGRAAQGALVH